MRVTVSAAISVDGFLDDASPERLILSSAADLRAVDILRARSDAILIGAGTIRSDNPSLIIRDSTLAAERHARGQATDPIKVTMTASGRLDWDAKFFTKGSGHKIVYQALTRHMLEPPPDRNVSIVSIADGATTASAVVKDLAERGVENLLVEGGSKILTMFFAEDLVDELRLAVAPFFVGDQTAPRFVNPGLFPRNKSNPMTVEKVEMLDGTTILTFSLRRAQ